MKFLKKNRFWSCFGKKVRFWSKFPKNVDFFGNFEKNSILSNFRKNFEFGQNLRKTFFLEFGKISILVKFSNISILIMIFEKNLKKLRFWTKLAKIFEKMSILVKFSKIFDLGPNLQKRIFLKNSQKVDFIQILENYRFWLKFTKKIGIWV